MMYWTNFLVMTVMQALLLMSKQIKYFRTNFAPVLSGKGRENAGIFGKWLVLMKPLTGQ